MIWVWLSLVVSLTGVVALVALRLHAARERLDRMESRLAAVLEGSDSGLAVWNHSGSLLGCNKRFREFYPAIQLKPGLVFEDLIRFTATRGLIQLPDEQVETWVEQQLARFGEVAHDELRTPDGRWLEIDTRPTGAGEVLLLFTDVTHLREAQATLSVRSERLQRQSADLTLLADAIRIGSTERTVDAAAAAMVSLVCQWAGWPVGYAYRVSCHDQAGALDPMPAWFAAAGVAEACSGLREIISHQQVKRGDGIAGRAFQTGRVSWIPNVSVDPSIDDEVRSAMIGIRGACAVPVTHGDAVVAVLVFLASDQLVPDPSVTRLLEAVAETLGWVWQARDEG